MPVLDALHDATGSGAFEPSLRSRGAVGNILEDAHAVVDVSLDLPGRCRGDWRRYW